MTLREVHILFIVMSIALSGFFAYWAYNQYKSMGSYGYLITSVVSVLVVIGLGIYSFNFAKKVKD